jgi:Na+/melibiose symporter-like transporter
MSNESPLKKALKELGRLVLFAVPGILIQVFTDNAALAASYGGTILLVLKSIDKYIHTDPNNSLSGIAPF